MVARSEAEQLVRTVPTEPYYAGGWDSSRGADTFDVIDPVTERRLATVVAAGAADVDGAVSFARSALDDGAWGRTDGTARGYMLNRLADLIEERTEVFATLESLDIGKPGFESRAIDLPQTVHAFRYFAGWADKVEGRSIPTSAYMGRPTHSYTVREPVGVVAAITPWNSPTMIGAWKIAPALAAGCAVVLKPPEDAPLTSLLLASLIEEAGFPAGAFSVLPGRGAVTGQLLIDHPGVDKISFTGSPETGYKVALAAAKGFRRTTLELGGKSPQIVYADADLDEAARGVGIGIFANQGEVCAAGSRILVARAVYDEFVELLVDQARNVKLGDPFDEGTTMGALINERHVDRVSRYIASGLDDGARLLVGGHRPERKGYFIEPTLFAEASNSMTIARQEIFGPVGTIIAFDSDEEAVALANDSDYALAATLWTCDVSRAHVVARRMKAGAVAINGWSPLDPRLPWGGFKLSGQGRELGWSGIEANTEEKAVTAVLSYPLPR
ncbi:aldehyde dehydrogenase family protein [Streptomyces sp. NA02950]|uniref:aldehyde dehydrogenase family protein n=1 Tax=Streptomyces sp. NA02950 TaxID=2742137 RepID=UPI00159171F9|nr:aldehyde dehydrogenase family protein [Streptomyces sp. NA02950]QKV93090.1 aldehyde dehydrogenase family protein [Streptomyces sp. NA02950]